MEDSELQLDRERLAAQQAKDVAAQRSASGASVTDQRVKLADADFSRWQGAAEQERKWIETLAECRLKYAQADLTEAQAAYELAKTADKLQDVRKKYALMARMERELQQLRQSEYRHRQEMKRLANNALAASAVRNLPHISPQSVAAMWNAWRYFLRRCPEKVVAKLAGSMALVEQLQCERRVPAAGTQEHLMLIVAFSLVADCADTIRTDAEAKLAALRAGTYDVWKPEESTASVEGG